MKSIIAWTSSLITTERILSRRRKLSDIGFQGMLKRRINRSIMKITTSCCKGRKHWSINLSFISEITSELIIINGFFSFKVSIYSTVLDWSRQLLSTSGSVTTIWCFRIYWVLSLLWVFQTRKVLHINTEGSSWVFYQWWIRKISNIYIYMDIINSRDYLIISATDRNTNICAQDIGQRLRLYFKKEDKWRIEWLDLMYFWIVEQ